MAIERSYIFGGVHTAASTYPATQSVISRRREIPVTPRGERLQLSQGLKEFTSTTSSGFTRSYVQGKKERKRRAQNMLGRPCGYKLTYMYVSQAYTPPHSKSDTHATISVASFPGHFPQKKWPGNEATISAVEEWGECI